MMSSSSAPLPVLELTLTATPLVRNSGLALLTLHIETTVPADKRKQIHGVVAMLEEVLYLEPSTSLADCDYRWYLRAPLLGCYLAMFKSYFEFLDIRCN